MSSDMEKEKNITNRREFVRVKPSEEQPVVVQISEKLIRVRDISAGGIAFDNDGFMESNLYPTKLKLPDQITMESTIIIISIDEQQVCHAKFVKIDPSQSETIHKYVLKRQIEIAREKKVVKSRNWHTRL